MKLDNVVASIPDDRDFPYVKRPGPFLPELDLKPNVYEVEDQGSLNLCVANAVVSATEEIKPESGSRMFVSYNTRHLIENTSGNVGTSLRDGLRAAYHWGIPLEADWQYNPGLIDTTPTLEVYSNGLPRRVTGYEKVDIADLNAIKSALNEGLPVVIATHIGEDIKNLTGPWQTQKMRPTSFNGSGNVSIGNHATLIIGYNDKLKDPCPGWIMQGGFLVQNSWSKTWGDGGFFCYPYQAFLLDAMEAWVIRGFAGVNPPKYVTPPTTVLAWYHSVYRVDVTDPLDPNVQYWANNVGGERAFLTSYKTVVDDTINARLQSIP